MSVLVSPDMTLSDLKEIIKTKYLHHGDYTLSSGARSDKYFDLKGLMSNFYDKAVLRTELYRWLSTRDTLYKCLGGIELGGALIVACMNHAPYDKSTCYIRKSQRIHGLKKMIEGNPVSPILLVDDVISSGDTLVDAAEEVVGAGYDIAGCLCVINRHRGTFDEFSCKYYGSKLVEFPIFSLFKEADFS